MRHMSTVLQLCLALIISSICSAFSQPKAVQVTETDKPKQPGISIRSADIILKVSDFQAARARVLNLARKYEAELRDAQTEVNFPGQKHGDLTLRVEASRLNDLVNELRSIGKLYSERLQTVDQTSYYDKLERRSVILKQNEAELQDFLQRPRRMRGSDILFVQYRLFQTRVEASDAMQERSDLERGTQRSLLHVMLFEPEPKKTFDWKSWHALAVYRAKGSFLYVVRKMVTGAYFTFYFAPFWIPLSIVLFIIGRKVRRIAIHWWTQREERVNDFNRQ